MNSRLVLATVLVGVLAVTAGCTGFFGPGQIPDEQLTREADYDWDTSANATVNLTGGQYQAIYKLSNQSSLSVYQYEMLGEERPVEVSAVQFRYPNGTVVTANASQLEVEKTNSETVIRAPAEDGTLAYTATAPGSSFTLPVYLEDESHEVVLPAGMRVGVFLLSNVQPGDYTTDTRDNRVHIYWEEVETNSITVQYYLERDLTIFGAVIAGVVVIGVFGLAYFRLQIRRLEERREEMGLNRDISDDDFGGGGGPPGMG